MKKLILVLSLVCILPLYASADNSQNDSGQAQATGKQPISPGGSDGCGLGWQVTDKKTWFGTSTRGTTNAFIPPTFGMTSGTIGCEQHPIAKNDQEAAKYAYNNYDSLTIQMAEGRGEVLDGFAKAMGCSDVTAFGKMTQSNYKQIIQAPSPVQMFETIKSKVVADPASCNAV